MQAETSKLWQNSCCKSMVIHSDTLFNERCSISTHPLHLDLLELTPKSTRTDVAVKLQSDLIAKIVKRCIAQSDIGTCFLLHKKTYFLTINKQGWTKDTSLDQVEKEVDGIEQEVDSKMWKTLVLTFSYDGQRRGFISTHPLYLNFPEIISILSASDIAVELCSSLISRLLKYLSVKLM